MQHVDLKLVDYARLMGISYQTAWRRWKAGTLQGYQLPSRTIAIRITVQQVASAIAGLAGTYSCPVCDTSFEVTTQQPASALACICPVCDWTLTPDSTAPDSLETTLHLNWAKQMWGKLQSFVSEPASEITSKHRTEFLTHISTPTLSNTLSLETRLDALQIQLQQAAEERMELRDRLDWILARIEPANFEQIQPMFSQLSTKFSISEELTASWSEVEIDYTPLQALLANGDWREADVLTWQLILQAMQREQAGWLSLDEIARFPLADLLTLNWLWHEYSGGQWGWTQQHAIWQSVEGDYAAFCDRVGWRVMDNWIYYSDLSFSTSAIAGHLPVICWRKRACYGVGGSPAAENEAAWLARYEACAAACETAQT